MGNFIKTYKELCEKYNYEDLDINAKDIFELQDWIIKFENISKKDYSEYFDYNLDNFLKNYHEEIEKKDILLHLLETVKSSILYIMNNMRTKIIREDIMIPASKVKEINSKGIMWLSRKPGDTIRKKLASSRNMLSIKRRLSIDTGENRLFVEFLKQIKYYLEFRLDNLPKELTEDLFTELYVTIDNFLKNDELEEVKRWANLPPNNTLLSDQNYRKIWNAWNELRDLDIDIRKYSEESEAYKRIDIVDNLKKILKARGNNYTFPQLPFNVDIKEYKIEPKTSIVAISPKNRLVDLENIKNTDLKEKYKEEKKEILISEKIISTDLFHIKPICINENDKILNFDNKILFQKFFDSNFVSCEKSEAMFFNKNTQIFSFSKTLFSKILNENDETEENLRMVMKIIERNIKSKILNTTFPDILDPFQVSTLSKKLRLSYKKVRILPRSIASIYALNNSEIFENTYKKDENILIFDIVNKKITFTLLKGKEEESYSNFIWERHWTNKKEIDNSFFQKLEEILKIDNLELEELYSLGEIEDLIQGFQNLKFILNNNRILEVTSEMINSIKNNKIDITEIVDEIFENNQEINKKNLHIITLKNSMRIDESYCKTFTNLSLEELVIGCSRYHRILNELNKDKKNEVILWKDYLPYLGIKKMYGRFDLIKNQKVQPMYNKSYPIPVKEHITLTKGKDEHKFTLVGEDQNEEIIYEAFVKHRNTLKEDIECELELQYTYGSDDPYELYFIPIKSKEFSRVKVSWKERKEYEYINLKYPQFPDREDWDTPEIQKIISNKEYLFLSFTNWCLLNTENINLDLMKENSLILKDDYISKNLYIPYEKYNINLNTLDEEHIRLKLFFNEEELKIMKENKVISFFVKKKTKGVSDYKLENIMNLWKTDKNGELFIKTNADIIGKESYKILFIYQDKFLIPEDCNSYLNQIEFNIENHKGHYRAINIKVSDKKYFDYEIMGVKKGVNKILGGINPIYNGSLIFGLHTLFADGKSVEDLTCPKNFKEYLKDISKFLVEMYNVIEDKGYIFYILSLISKDLGEDYYNIALDIIEKEKIKTIRKNNIIKFIGYGLGNLNNEYSKKLFNSIEKSSLNFEEKVEILSKAIWKNRDFIFNINKELLINYFENSIDVLESKLKNGVDTQKRWQILGITYILELIYSVFRYREFYKNDEELLRRLSLNNIFLKKLYILIEKLIDLKIEIISRIEFEEKEKNKNLLYAILLCINGSDEKDIRISKISDDRNDGDENE